MHRVGQMELYARFLQLPHKQMAHLLGILAFREDPAAPLGDRLHPPGPEQLQQVHIGEPTVGAVQEFPVPRRLGDEIPDGGAVRQIAPPLPGDAHFQPDAVHLLEEMHLRAELRRVHRC